MMGERKKNPTTDIRAELLTGVVFCFPCYDISVDNVHVRPFSTQPTVSTHLKKPVLDLHENEICMKL